MPTPRANRALIRIIRRNRFLSSSRIRVELIRRAVRRVSARTVQIRLVAAGYCSRCLARCPRLTHDHRRRRRVGHAGATNGTISTGLVWYLLCLPLWWSYPSSSTCWWETSGLLHPKNGWKYRPLPHGMGSSHASCKAKLVVVDETVNQQRYTGILRRDLLPSARVAF